MGLLHPSRGGRASAAEAAFLAREARLRAVFENVADGLCLADPDGCLLEVNRTFCAMLGYSEQELASRDFASVTYPEDVPACRESLRCLLAGESNAAHMEIRYLRSDGSPVWAEVDTTLLRDEERRPLYFIAQTHDLTDRQRIEDTQRLAALGQLAAGVAHEFNNLLASLMLQADLTAASPTPEQWQGLLETAQAVASRGGDACRNLAMFARPEATRREALCVEAAIEAALALAARQFANSEVVVARDYETAGQHVYADARRLEQVFINLFLNACHAMPQGGVLTVATRYLPEGGGQIVVTVTDTGTGIRREDLPRIFEPFFTTKGSRGDGNSTGSGLGLSVSHGIIRAHGGELRAHSELGVGTTLEVSLPAHVGPVGAPPAGDTQAGVSARPVRGRTARILVAEDTEAVSSLMEAVLVAEGHRVRCVTTTREAIAEVCARPYDLIITDLLMPGGGGREVLSCARRRARPIPVLVISGLTEAEVEEDALLIGAAGFLHKPFTGAELNRAVEALLAATTACRP